MPYSFNQHVWLTCTWKATSQVWCFHLKKKQGQNESKLNITSCTDITWHTRCHTLLFIHTQCSATHFIKVWQNLRWLLVFCFKHKHLFCRFELHKNPRVSSYELIWNNNIRIVQSSNCCSHGTLAQRKQTHIFVTNTVPHARAQTMLTLKVYQKASASRHPSKLEPPWGLFLLVSCTTNVLKYCNLSGSPM